MNTENHDKIIQLNKKGLEHYKNKNYQEAINTFTELLNIIKYGKTETQEFAVCYYNLGSTYFELGDTIKATKYLNESFDIYEELYGNYNNKSVKIKNKLDELAGKNQILINSCKIITSNIYIKGSENGMLNEINKVKQFLNEQADMYGFIDDFKEVHKSLVSEELEEFETDVLYCYAVLVKMSIPNNHDYYITNKKGKRKLIVKILEEKYKQLETLRIHRYIVNVLFDREENDFLGEFTYYYRPDLKTIKENGVNFYYPDIVNFQFSNYELLHLTAFLDYMYNVNDRKFNINDVSNDVEFKNINIINDVIQRIFSDTKDKKHYYLTILGFKKIYSL